MAEQTSFDMSRIRSVVLVPRQDFGRSALGVDLPAALWPIAGRPVIERLLRHLAEDGITRVALCCGEDVSASVSAIPFDSRLSVRLVIEKLTSGTAGCLRDAVVDDPGDLILVLSGGIACPPCIPDLIEAHAAGQADLTMVFNPGPPNEPSHWAPAEIYLCKPTVLRQISSAGYCDIKEGLIPAVQRAGGMIKPFMLSRHAGNFHDHVGYLHAVSLYLRSDAAKCDGYPLCEPSDKRLTAMDSDNIDSTARLYGPVAIAQNARIAKGAVVVGPAVLDRGTRVDENSVVVGSVLWEGSTIGAGCEVRESIIGRRAVIPAGSALAEQVVGAGQEARLRQPFRTAKARVRGVVDRAGGGGEPLAGEIAPTGFAWSQMSPSVRAGLLGAGVILAVFLWSYWAEWVELWQIWRRSDEYSAGLLVPFLAAYVVWTRRQDLTVVSVRPAILWGSILFVMAQAVRGVGLYFMYGSAEMLAVVLSVTALTILLLGWGLTWKLASILAFLCLMLPLPHRVQAQISLPLQSWATDSAVFCLELIGYDVVQDGNVINIGKTSVAVAEACNGLRMVTAFLVISGLVVLLVRRSWWQKLIVLASSLPIALLCNTLRLTVTAMFFRIFESTSAERLFRAFGRFDAKQAETLFHDFGGYAMMPLALALVVGEFWLLRRLFTPQTGVMPAVIARRTLPHAADS